MVVFWYHQSARWIVLPISEVPSLRLPTSLTILPFLPFPPSFPPLLPYPPPILLSSPPALPKSPFLSSARNSFLCSLISPSLLLLFSPYFFKLFSSYSFSASLPSPPSSPYTPLPPSAPTPSIPFEFYSRIPSNLPSTTESQRSPPRFSSSTSTEPSPPPILAFPRFHVSTIRTSESAQATCFPAIPSTARRCTAIYSSISRGNTIPNSPRFWLRPIWSRFSAVITRWTGTR